MWSSILATISKDSSLLFPSVVFFLLTYFPCSGLILLEIVFLRELFKWCHHFWIPGFSSLSLWIWLKLIFFFYVLSDFDGCFLSIPGVIVSGFYSFFFASTCNFELVCCFLFFILVLFKRCSPPLSFCLQRAPARVVLSHSYLLQVM